MAMGMKIALIAVVMALAAEMGIEAKEIFNAKVVEYFEQVIGYTGLAHVGIDTTGDGLTDMFINIYPLESAPARRLANLIKNAGVVSIEDKDKVFSQSLGAYTVTYKNVLEVGGKPIPEIFPNMQGTYPDAYARQERLKQEAPANTAAQPSAEERRIRELEEELRRLREGR